jgi:hypothetical protein
MQPYLRSRQRRHPVAMRQAPKRWRKCPLLDHGHRQALRRKGFDGRPAVADKSQPPRPVCGIQRLHGPSSEETALRIKRNGDRVYLLRPMLNACRPDRLLHSQQFTLAMPFWMHRDDEIVALSKPIIHRARQPGLHFDVDQRIIRDEARQQWRDKQFHSRPSRRDERALPSDVRARDPLLPRSS